jgi:1-acyl-sn-glycerol-3-phosphate acyltransferase
VTVQPRWPQPGAPQARAPQPVDRSGTFPTAWARTRAAGVVREGVQRWLMAPVVRSQVSVTVAGRELLDGVSGPVVFVANHSSHLDTPVVLGALPRRWARRTVVAAAADYFFDVWWRAASTALALNTFPLERRGGRRSPTTPGDLLADGWNLLIFAEGTRSEDGTIGPFKLGPAYLAVQAGLPVVPIALRGTYAAMPRDSRWPAPGRLPVTVRFGSPVVPAVGETPRQFAPRVRDAVVRLVAEDAGTWWEAQRAPSAPVPRSATPVDAPGRWRAVWESSQSPPRPRRRTVWRRTARRR